MKEQDFARTEHWFMSEVMPGVGTQNSDWAKAIKWADEEQPVIYKILAENRSKVLGGGSNFFLGGQKSVVRVRDAQGNKCRDIDFAAVLSRLCQVYNTLTDPIRQICEAPFDIFRWRIEFTLAHYHHKGFCGGCFQQYDEKYLRNSLELDYTQETLPLVIQRFRDWAERSHKTNYIMLDTVRVACGLDEEEEL